MFLFGTKKKEMTQEAREGYIHAISSCVDTGRYYEIAAALTTYALAEVNSSTFNSVLNKVAQFISNKDRQVLADSIGACLDKSLPSHATIALTEKFFEIMADINPYSGNSGVLFQGSNLDIMEKIGQIARRDKNLSEYLTKHWDNVMHKIPDSDHARDYAWYLCRGAVLNGSTPRPSDIGDLALESIFRRSEREREAGEMKSDAYRYFGYGGLKWAKDGSPTQFTARYFLLSSITAAKTPDDIAAIVESTCHHEGHKPDEEIDIAGSEQWRHLVAAMDTNGVIDAIDTVIGDRMNQVIGDSTLLFSAIDVANKTAAPLLQSGSCPEKLLEILNLVVADKLGAFNTTKSLLKQAKPQQSGDRGLGMRDFGALPAKQS